MTHWNPRHDEQPTRPMGPSGWRSHEENEERFRGQFRGEPGRGHESHFGPAECPACGYSGNRSERGEPARWSERGWEGGSYATPPQGFYGAPGSPSGSFSSQPGGFASPRSGFAPSSPYSPNVYGAGPGPQSYDTSGYGAGYRPGPAREPNPSQPSWGGGAPGTPQRGYETLPQVTPMGEPFSSSPNWGGTQGWTSRERSAERARVGRGPKGYKRSDERIREDISDRLMQTNLDAGNVTVRVAEGEVTLEGTVDDRQAKRIIEDLCEAMLGVTQVNNHLRVESNESATDKGERDRGTDTGSQRDRSRSGQPSGGSTTRSHP